MEWMMTVCFCSAVQMAALAKPIVVGSTPGADQDDFLKVMEDPELHPNVSALPHPVPIPEPTLFSH
jgi:hypothetical protein